MIQVFYNNESNWSEPEYVHDNPHPKDWGFDMEEFGEIASFMKGQCKALDELCATFDPSAKAWEGHVGTDPECPEIRAFTRIKDLGCLVVGTMEAFAGDEYRCEAVVTLPYTRRARFDPDLNLCELSFIGNKQAAVALDKLMATYWSTRFESAVFCIVPDLKQRAVWDESHEVLQPKEYGIYSGELRLKLLRASLRFAAARDAVATAGASVICAA